MVVNTYYTIRQISILEIEEILKAFNIGSIFKFQHILYTTIQSDCLLDTLIKGLVTCTWCSSWLSMDFKLVWWNIENSIFTHAWCFSWPSMDSKLFWWNIQNSFVTLLFHFNPEFKHSVRWACLDIIITHSWVTVLLNTVEICWLVPGLSTVNNITSCSHRSSMWSIWIDMKYFN